jgi:hypothetical protein
MSALSRRIIMVHSSVLSFAAVSLGWRSVLRRGEELLAFDLHRSGADAALATVAPQVANDAAFA